jgi:mannosyltransferase OCH1-like enzyme
LIFVAETLISKTEDPVESFFNEVRLTDMFKEAWEDPFVPIWLLDILTCNAAIFKAKRELIPFFRAETNISKKLDMCRVAALYLSGGYQIHIDLEVRSIPNTPDNTGLLIAREGDAVSQRFIAAEPECGTMKTTLDIMVELSKEKLTRPDFDLVTEALSRALLIPNPDPSAHAVFVPLATIGGAVSSPWIVTDQPVYKFDNPVPLEMRGPPSLEYSIPRRLLFTYKYNLLEAKDPPLLYQNVQNTIQKYREAWGDPDAAVWFLDDDACRAAIYFTKRNLLTYFDREIHGSWKADICRIAALYLTGGQYLDVDMEVVAPWLPDRNVAFATATNPDETRYFQSFLASERNGRILEEALDAMLLFYMNKKTRIMALIGPDTLNWAIRSVPVSEQGKIVLLKEAEAIHDAPDTPLRRNAVGCCCNFVVQDPATNQTLFYSRVVGGGNKCMFHDSHEGQVWLAKDALQKKI